MDSIVKIKGNELTTTTKIVADVFGKVHRDVIRALEQLDCSEEFRDKNFLKSTYKTNRGKTYNCFRMTESGALLLCMGFTGIKSMQNKEQLVYALGDSVAISKAIDLLESVDIDEPDLFIYIAQEDSSGRYKIGISKNPERRVKELNVGNPENLLLIHKSIASDGFKSEKKIHNALSAHNIRSEWFDCIDDLMSIDCY